MAIILKNKTSIDIEIDELGITVPANDVYDLGDDNSPSVELNQLIEAGTIVYMDDSDPDNMREMSVDQSVLMSKATSGIDPTVYYLKTEIDSILEDYAKDSEVYTKSASYSKTEVDSIIDGLVNGAPDLLDTITEIAAALGNDSNFATNITNLINNKADLTHTHDSRYYTKTQINTELSQKANVNHTHNGYAPSNHNHDTRYAGINHNHSGYAPSNHNHDTRYAGINHNHDAYYALKSHNHDTKYYTQSQVDDMLEQFVFGRNYQTIDSLGVSTTTASWWQNKTYMDVYVDTAGYYRVGWSYEWNGNSTSRDFRARLMVAGSTVMEHRQEPKDTAGAFSSTGSDQMHPGAGFKTVWLEPGYHRVQLDYCTSQSNYHASIWNVSLEFWRVS